MSHPQQFQMQPMEQQHPQSMKGVTKQAMKQAIKQTIPAKKVDATSLWLSAQTPTQSAQLYNHTKTDIHNWLQSFYNVLLVKKHLLQLIHTLNTRGIYPGMMSIYDYYRRFPNMELSPVNLERNQHKIVTFWEFRVEKYLLPIEITMLYDYFMTLRQLDEQQGDKRGLFLWGLPGTGKSLTAELIAQEIGYEVISFHGIDKRTKKDIQDKISESLQNHNILDIAGDFKPFVIIMDELDSVVQKGTFSEILKLINPSKSYKKPTKHIREYNNIVWRVPIICICNNFDKKKLSEIKTECLCIYFEPPTVQELVTIGRRVLQQHAIKCSEQNLHQIAGKCGGDIRYLVNSLQFLSNNGAIKNLDVQFQKLVENLENKERDLTLYELSQQILCEVDTPATVTNAMIDACPSLAFMLHENYPKLCQHTPTTLPTFSESPCPRSAKTTEYMDIFVGLADIFSVTDVGRQFVFNDQHYSMLELINYNTISNCQYKFRELHNQGVLSNTPQTLDIDLNYPAIYKYTNAQLKTMSNMIGLRDQLCLVGYHKQKWLYPSSISNPTDFYYLYRLSHKYAGNQQFFIDYPFGTDTKNALQNIKSIERMVTIPHSDITGTVYTTMKNTLDKAYDYIQADKVECMVGQKKEPIFVDFFQGYDCS